MFKEGDWTCSGCGNTNWARRNTCNMCNTPKPGTVDTNREGHAGGFKVGTSIVWGLQNNLLCWDYIGLGLPACRPCLLPAEGAAALWGIDSRAYDAAL